MDDTIILRHRPERAAPCRLWGGGIVWRPPAQLVRVFIRLSIDPIIKMKPLDHFLQVHHNYVLYCDLHVFFEI